MLNQQLDTEEGGHSYLTAHKLINEIECDLISQLADQNSTNSANNNLKENIVKLKLYLATRSEKNLFELVKIIELCVAQLCENDQEHDQHGLRLIYQAIYVIKDHIFLRGTQSDDNRLANTALTLWSWLDRN